jgi:hypothetical protein
MQARKFCRGLLASTWLLALAACGNADNPYSRFSDPPLVSARLYAVMLVTDSKALVGTVAGAGWQPARLPPNYQQADAVQAGLWDVPEPVAKAITHFKGGKAGTPDVGVLVMPLAARGRVAADGINKAFFKNVLGTDVPVWPLPGAQPANVRIQVWTYLVPNIIEASKRLRANGIPVIYDPVAITTAYLGFHKTLAIRAPDGTVVQLVETTGQ